MTLKIGDVLTLELIVALENELDTRVYPTNACITLEYRPTRRNIVYDQQTMSVTMVYYG